MIFKRNLTSFTRILLNSAGNKGGSSKTETNAKVNQNTTAQKQSKSPSEASSQTKKETKKAETIASPPPPPPKEPFRNDQYNCKEYFSYDRFSFFAIDLQMSDKRLPQKSNKQQYK